MYIAVVTPFRVFFHNDPKPGTALYYFELTGDFIFIADIFLNFITGIVNANDEVEYDPFRISVTYFKSWFGLDGKTRTICCRFAVAFYVLAFCNVHRVRIPSVRRDLHPNGHGTKWSRASPSTSYPMAWASETSGPSSFSRVVAS